MNVYSNFCFATGLKLFFAALLVSTPLVAQPKAQLHSQPARITPEAWRKAHQDIRVAGLEAKIDYLLDRAEIEDIITTYAFGQYEFWLERTPEGWKVSKLAQVNRTRINTSEAKFPEEVSP